MTEGERNSVGSRGVGGVFDFDAVGAWEKIATSAIAV